MAVMASLFSNCRCLFFYAFGVMVTKIVFDKVPDNNYPMPMDLT
jgi:hypothetical protein